MVCSRCITIIKAELNKVGVSFSSVEIGEVTLLRKLTSAQHKQLSKALKKLGFELIGALKKNLVERLNGAISELERNSDEELRTSYSNYISQSLNDNFISLNTLLAEIKGISIEKFIIKHKVDLVKGLLLDKALNLDEIALRMHYSNVAHLSYQFKSITGMTPSHFRQLQQLNNKNFERN